MKGRKTIRISLILLFSLSFMALIQIRCRHDGLNAASLETVCYQRDVAPIFLNSCGTTGCHSSGEGESGLDFTNYTSVMKSINPFNAQKSKAYQAITGKAFVPLMPPGGALSENERILIRVWIDQGAKNTTCTTTGSVNTALKSLGEPVCFQRDLLPVLMSSCGTTGCHDQTTRSEGYNITSYASVMSNLVKAGSPTTSKLYTVIKNNSMPPGSYAKLTQAVKDSIYNWIKNGAANQTCVSTCDTTGVVSYVKQISSVMSKNCVSCHIAANPSKGIILDSYASVKTYLDNGKLMAAVKGTSIQMPPGFKLTACEMRQLELWKSNGAIQN